MSFIDRLKVNVRSTQREDSRVFHFLLKIDIEVGREIVSDTRLRSTEGVYSFFDHNLAREVGTESKADIGYYRKPSNQEVDTLCYFRFCFVLVYVRFCTPKVHQNAIKIYCWNKPRRGG